MHTRELGDERKSRKRLVLRSIWLVLIALSGYVAGRASGMFLFNISVFHHTVSASILAVALLLACLWSRTRFPRFSGLCLWLSAFSVGLISLR